MQEYLDLVRTRLGPFAERGLDRDDLEAELRRLESVALLFRILENRVSTYALPGFIAHRERLERRDGLVELLDRMGRAGRLPDCEFIVVVSDGARGEIPMLSSITFDQWPNIAAPLGCKAGPDGGTYTTGWDERMAGYRRVATEYPWDARIGKAIFRGALRVPSQLTPAQWGETARGRMYLRARERPDLFDVGFTKYGPPYGEAERKIMKDGAPPAAAIPLAHQQRYKYQLCVGAWFGWADRARILPFLDSLMLLHDAGCQEFFTSLLRDGEHFLKIDEDFSNLVERVEWAKAHDGEVREIVRNANAFAERFVSEKAMTSFMDIFLAEYAKLLRYRPSA